MIMYHGTTMRAARRIRVEGFNPRPPSKRVWFAQSRAYAQQRARTKARRGRDRAVVLSCEIDVNRLRQTLGSRRVMQRGRVLAVSGPVPAMVLRSHGILGVPGSPEELVQWIDEILRLKRHKGPGKNHPGILRIARWVDNRIAVNPDGDLSEKELLSLAQQWLPEYFEGVEVDFEHLRTLPKAPDPAAREAPELPPWEGEEEEEDTREEEALGCLESDKPKQRQRGLELLIELEDPDLFEWCAMFLEDEDTSVRVKALKTMRHCEDIEPEFIAPLADAEEKLVRAAAIEVLALRGGPAAPQWFWKGVTDPEPHVRLSTAHHLDELDPQENREIYETVLYDPHPDVARIGKKLTEGKGFAKIKW